MTARNVIGIPQKDFTILIPSMPPESVKTNATAMSRIPQKNLMPAGGPRIRRLFQGHAGEGSHHRVSLGNQGNSDDQQHKCLHDCGQGHIAEYGKCQASAPLA